MENIFCKIVLLVLNIMVFLSIFGNMKRIAVHTWWWKNLRLMS